MELLEQNQTYLLLATPLWGVLAYFIAHRLGFFRPPKEKEPKNWISIGHVLLAFCGYIIVQLGVGLVFRSLWINQITQEAAMQGQAIVQLVAILFSSIFLILISWWKRTRALWGKLYKSAWWIGAVSWFIIVPWVLFVSGIGSWFVQDFLESTPIDQDPVRYLKALAFSPLLFWSTALAMVTIIPLSEEILFRGFLQTYLCRFLSNGLAVFFSALIFTLFHFSYAQGLSNLEVLPALFLLSCFLGYLRVHTSSLLSSISLHSLFNLINVITLFIFT